jgi:hypothetical protein
MVGLPPLKNNNNMETYPSTKDDKSSAPKTANHNNKPNNLQSGKMTNQ